MWDHYRVRFKLLNPRRRAIGRDFSGLGRSRMPRTLFWLFALGWLVSGGVFALALHRPGGHGGPLALFVTAHALLVPVSFTLGVGLSERQAWTRPLLLALLAAGAVALAVAGVHTMAGLVGAGVASVGAYLYRSPGVRDYFAELRSEQIVRLETQDLRGLVLVPLYGAWAGIAAGIGIGWLVVSRHLADRSAPGPMGPNDALAIVLGCFVGALVLGLLGRLAGEAVARRLGRAS